MISVKALLMLTAAAATAAVASADLASFDCKMKQLGVDFAQSLQSFRAPESFQQQADALNGAPNQGPACTVAPQAASAAPASWADVSHRESASTYYVDAVGGSDSNPGTLAQPFQTIPKVRNTKRNSCVCCWFFPLQATSAAFLR